MAIDETDKHNLRLSQDGLLTYEYIANHIDNLTAEDLDELVDVMIDTDLSGQFLASAARYLPTKAGGPKGGGGVVGGRCPARAAN